MSLILKPAIAYHPQMMFDEDLPKPKTAEFPRNFDGMSVAELEDYITELKEEITKAEANIAKKKASTAAADSVFKS
ncbi:MAG: DUF1192 domain-containing protein [Alphaproteobacteria bacterium]